MRDVRWQSQQSSAESSPVLSPYVPHEAVDEIEIGQRHRIVRPKQQQQSQEQQQQQQRQTAQPVRPVVVARQPSNYALLRRRLLSVLLVALGVVLLLLSFVVFVLPTWQHSTGSIADSRAALRRVGVLTEQLPSELYTDEAALQRLVTFYTADSNDTANGTAEAAETSGLLVLHVAHGLSNRVRTLASALLFAHHFHLALRLIWVPDHHCRATFTQLFHLPSTTASAHLTDATHSRVYPTWQRFRAAHLCERDECAVAAQHLSDQHFDLYRYIDMTGQALDYRPTIVPPTAGRSLYVHSSTRLNYSLDAGSGGSMDHLWPALFVLQPSDTVTAYLTAFDGRYPDMQLDTALGLHIRQLQPTAEMAGLQPHEYTAAMWAGLTAARRLCNFDYFQQLVNTTVAADPTQLFYVAADSPAAIQLLRQHFGHHRFVSVRDVAPHSTAVCDGSERSAECVQLALADQLLLARCGWIHGSVWSSFSDVAGLWRMAPVLYPTGVPQLVREVADNVSRDGVGDGGLR